MNLKALGSVTTETLNSQEVLKYRVEYPYEISRKYSNVITHTPKKGHVPCYRIWMGGYIGFNGDLRPCCDFDTFSMGNVIRDGFAEVWNGEKFLNFRRAHALEKLEDYPQYVQKTCGTCNLKLNEKIHLFGKYLHFIRGRQRYKNKK